MVSLIGVPKGLVSWKILHETHSLRKTTVSGRYRESFGSELAYFVQNAVDSKITPNALCKTPVRSRSRASLGKGDPMLSAKPRLEAGILHHWAKGHYGLLVSRVPFGVFLISFLIDEEVEDFWPLLLPFVRRECWVERECWIEFMLIDRYLILFISWFIVFNSWCGWFSDVL